MDVFEFTDYRDYLRAKLSATGPRSGLRKQLSQEVGVHSSFVSQVLSGKAEFSLEQADGINHFLQHTEDESEFFLNLVLLNRAGTQRLRQRFRESMCRMLQARSNLQKRLHPKSQISAADRERFYSSTIYPLVHVLSTIPKCQSAEKIAQLLRAEPQKIREALAFLHQLGLVEMKGDRVTAGKNHVHLGNESPLVSRHHTNWRVFTLPHLGHPENLHYSGCFSLSHADATAIKEDLVKLLKRVVERVSHSREETLYTFCLDFFEPFNLQS